MILINRVHPFQGRESEQLTDGAGLSHVQAAGGSGSSGGGSGGSAKPQARLHRRGAGTLAASSAHVDVCCLSRGEQWTRGAA